MGSRCAPSCIHRKTLTYKPSAHYVVEFVSPYILAMTGLWALCETLLIHPVRLQERAASSELGLGASRVTAR